MGHLITPNYRLRFQGPARVSVLSVVTQQVRGRVRLAQVLWVHPLERGGEAWREAETPHLPGRTQAHKLNQGVSGGKEAFTNSKQERGTCSCLAVGTHQPTQRDALSGDLDPSNCPDLPWTLWAKWPRLWVPNTIPCTWGHVQNFTSQARKANYLHMGSGGWSAGVQILAVLWASVSRTKEMIILGVFIS